ncbi:MAG TPA: SDR family NAD(P)-dependent oxidoreductase [Draconibacterium sp.]|nr:SDR family NAD(P)-dependent oxidoreductase [Draconibacterium sp.]
MNVKDKTIVVTGGGNGLGRALVTDLLERGARVAAIDINKAALNETSELAGKHTKNLLTLVADITDRNAVENLPEQVIAKFNSVDGIINNAGIIQPFIKVNDLSYQTIDRVMNVDFYGTLHITKAFLPYLLKRSEAHIVNVSSMGGLFPVPGQGIYGAAKSAVKLLTESLQAELENTTVKVTLVFPGGIETDIKFNSGAEKNQKDNNASKKAAIQPLKPAKAAQLIINAMEKNKDRILIGTDIRMMNFIHQLSRRMAIRLINKQMKTHIPD